MLNKRRDGLGFELVCKEAAMQPVRPLVTQLEAMESSRGGEAVPDGGPEAHGRRVTHDDMTLAMKGTKPSAKLFADKYRTWEESSGRRKVFVVCALRCGCAHDGPPWRRNLHAGADCPSRQDAEADGAAGWGWSAVWRPTHAVIASPDYARDLTRAVAIRHGPTTHAGVLTILTNPARAPSPRRPSRASWGCRGRRGRVGRT